MMFDINGESKKPWYASSNFWAIIIAAVIGAVIGGLFLIHINRDDPCDPCKDPDVGSRPVECLFKC